MYAIRSYYGSGTVVIGGEHGMITGSAGGVTRSESRRTEQFVVTVEGSSARINVGQQLPFTERWLFLARHHVQVYKSTRYVSVDTGFEVTPELLAGNRVELMILV